MTIRDPAEDLAEHVYRTRFEDLPATAVDATIHDIVDTLGCMLGGSGAAGVAVLLKVRGAWGGRDESRVLLQECSLPAHHAALMNAAMGHALDFDDTLDRAGSIHPGVSVLAAGLAIADRMDGVSGRDLRRTGHVLSRLDDQLQALSMRPADARRVGCRHRATRATGSRFRR